MHSFVVSSQDQSRLISSIPSFSFHISIIKSKCAEVKKKGTMNKIIAPCGDDRRPSSCSSIRNSRLLRTLLCSLGFRAVSSPHCGDGAPPRERDFVCGCAFPCLRNRSEVHRQNFHITEDCCVPPGQQKPVPGSFLLRSNHTSYPVRSISFTKGFFRSISAVSKTSGSKYALYPRQSFRSCKPRSNRVFPP